MVKVGLIFGSVGGAVATNATLSNPFQAGNWYVNAARQEEYDSSIASASGATKINLEGMRAIPSAYWIDVKAKIDDTSLKGMRGILADSAKKSTPELVVLIHYDVPNRDCKAVASNGEICCTYLSDGRCDYTKSGDCSAGLSEYETKYVDPFVKALKDFPTVPVVVIVEPDSLPNLATNLGEAKCGNTATQTAYKRGIAYAIEQLSTTHAALYIDAAHGGWLGWDDNLQAFLKLFGPSEMNVDMSKVRGFAQNVANYQAVGTVCPWKPDTGTRNGYCLPGGSGSGDACCGDPCKLISQYNPAVNEMNFAQSLVKASEKILGWTPVNIIDTGRNGVDDARTDCANWCNPRGMGTGLLPTTSTGSEFVDAFFWLKTPGESDGCTETTPDGTKCARYDTMCGSSDSIGSRSTEPRSPEAGDWFDFQVKMLATNAADTNWGPSPPPSPTPPAPPTPTPPTPTPPTPTPPTPTPPTPTPPTPTPTPPVSQPRCCWSAWGDASACGSYPAAGSGGLCNTDFGLACQSETECVRMALV